MAAETDFADGPDQGRLVVWPIFKDGRVRASKPLSVMTRGH